MRALPPARRPLAEALALGPALLARAREAPRAPWIAASLVDDPAVVLGAVQRAARVIERGACAASGVAVHRRATTGTAAFLGGRALIFSMALPHVAALAPDATARTLLNRNVRGFLRGFTRAGALAHYLGREWISLRRRPAVLLGVDVAQDGAVLIEAFAGVDAPLAIPPSLAAPEERAVDRWLGKAPAALTEVLPEALSLDELARVVVEAIAQHAALPLLAADEAPELARGPFEAITSPEDLLPPGACAAELARVPIGWIEAAALGGEPANDDVWLGGDLLTARWLLVELGRGAATASFDAASVPLEGASLSDLRALAQRARSARPRPGR